VAEMGFIKSEVIKGQKPNLNGYYYATVMYNAGPLLESAMAFLGMGALTLFYGHSGRGEMTLTYYGKNANNNPTLVPVNSAEYRNKIRQYTGFVEGR
jgi:hypothetical protein